MAPKRKASAAAKEVKKAENDSSIEKSPKEIQKENETTKGKGAKASDLHEKPSSKKAKPEPAASPMKTRARPDKAPAPVQPKESAKATETKAKESKPAKPSKAKASKVDESQPAIGPSEPVKKATEVPSTQAGEPKHSKHVIIEHCKQCNSFKTRALKVKESIEARVQGVKVSVNLEKPRKGCFEIRDDEGKIFVSLLDMPRPFKKMKELDLDAVIDDIVEKINGT